MQKKLHKYMALDAFTNKQTKKHATLKGLCTIE